jgi:hypothetical protein
VLSPLSPQRDARERADAAEARADTAARRQGAPLEELERQTKLVQRLRADVARKEQALKVDGGLTRPLPTSHAALACKIDPISCIRTQSTP